MIFQSPTTPPIGLGKAQFLALILDLFAETLGVLRIAFGRLEVRKLLTPRSIE